MARAFLEKPPYTRRRNGAPEKTESAEATDESSAHKTRGHAIFRRKVGRRARIWFNIEQISCSVAAAPAPSLLRLLLSDTLGKGTRPASSTSALLLMTVSWIAFPSRYQSTLPVPPPVSTAVLPAWVTAIKCHRLVWTLMRRMLARRCSGVAIGLRERSSTVQERPSSVSSRRRASTPTACGVLMLKRSASCGDAVVALLVLVLVLVVLLVVGDDDEGVVVDFKDDARDRDRLRGNHTHATNVYAERDLQIAPGIERAE